SIPEGRPVRLGAAPTLPLPERATGTGPATHAPPAPLAGNRVLELTLAWAGPFVGRFLSTLGADVVRLETGRYPDGWRTRLRWRDVDVEPPAGSDPGDYTFDAAPLFNTLGRGKRSASVDLSTDGGREVFGRLLAAADVLVVNMTATVLADRGVEDAVHAAVAERGLVAVTMPAAGATGPYRAMPGYGTLTEGMGGFAARFGYDDEGARVSDTYYPDPVAGIHGAVAALAGLAERAATGHGSFVDLSQQEVMWLQLGEGAALRSMEARDPDRLGNRELGCAVSGVWPTADGSWLAVAVADAAGGERDRLRQLVGPAGVGEWLLERRAGDALEQLRGVGLRAAEVATIESLHTGGQLARRGLLERLDHPVTGSRDYLGSPVRLDGRTLTTGRPAPLFGRHTDEVLMEWCGLSLDEIERLRDAGAVGTMPRTRPRSRPQTPPPDPTLAAPGRNADA